MVMEKYTIKNLKNLKNLKSLQWYITSHLPEWIPSINQQTTSAGEDVEKGEHFCTVGGNADWCNHCEKQYGETLKN